MVDPEKIILSIILLIILLESRVVSKERIRILLGSKHFSGVQSCSAYLLSEYDVMGGFDMCHLTRTGDHGLLKTRVQGSGIGMIQGDITAA